MKTKGPHSDALRKDLSRLIGGEKVKTEPEDLLAYSSDATRYYVQGKPEAVVLAASVDNVSKSPSNTPTTTKSRSPRAEREAACQGTRPHARWDRTGYQAYEQDP